MDSEFLSMLSCRISHSSTNVSRGAWNPNEVCERMGGSTFEFRNKNCSYLVRAVPYEKNADPGVRSKNHPFLWATVKCMYLISRWRRFRHLDSYTMLRLQSDCLTRQTER